MTGGIRSYPPMITAATDWNNLITYLGGADSNSQINTSRILLNTAYPNYALNGWESPSGGGKIYGAMIDSIAASILTGQVSGYTDATPSNPAGTTSTTGVMMGLAVSYTPTRSGIVQATVSGQLQNNTAGDGVKVLLYYGTGGAPTNGSALTGTQKGQGQYWDACATASKRYTFAFDTIVSGLTLNTAYWFDLGVAAITGGTASVAGLEIVITEL